MAERGTPAEEHVTNVVKAPVWVNSFALVGELPIPWKVLLSKWGRIYVKHLVTDSLLLAQSSHLCLALPNSWIINCKCENEGSLECFAGREVIKKLLLDFMEGGFYNVKWLWYRRSVNRSVSYKFQYVGSIMFRKTHYIYLRCGIKSKCEAIQRCFNPSTTHFIMTPYGFYIIMLCISCVSGKALTTACCARRVRRTIQRVYKQTKMRGWISSNPGDNFRQKALEAAASRGKCQDPRLMNVP